MSIFNKPDKPKPPPYTPTKADASIINAGEAAATGYKSMVNAGALTTPATTQKRSLLGGSA